MPTPRPLLISLLTLLVVGVTAVPAAAQSPGTLDGETLVAIFSKCNSDPGPPGPPPDSPCAFNPAPPVVEAECDEDGTSTLRYDIEATETQDQGAFTIPPASGPYPGTFREDGTVTIAPQDQGPVPTFDDPVIPAPFDEVLTGSAGFQTGALLTWTARFEINSGETTVVGRKTLTTEAPGFGVCTTFAGEPGPIGGGGDLTGYFGIADARLAYSATITTPEGVFRDEGTAQSDLRETFATYVNRHGDGTVTRDVGSDVGLLVEIFQSALDAPEPADADACKKGGFANFGGLDFRNQGDCVSFFATDGKNEPGQNIP